MEGIIVFFIGQHYMSYYISLQLFILQFVVWILNLSATVLWATETGWAWRFCRPTLLYV